MTDKQFWTNVELAKWPCDYNKAKIMYRKLFSREECAEFRSIKGKYHKELDRYITQKDHDNSLGVGDDGYNDLLNYIIGLGKKTYDKCLKDFELVKKLSESYEEPYCYCIPYDSDYDEKTNPYTINKIVKSAKSCIQEIEYFDKMDKDGKYLMPIVTELRYLEAWVLGVLVEKNENGLKGLIGNKAKVEKATKAIDKFFNDEYLELPRKFTERRENGSNFNGFCTAKFNNLCDDAELVLEYLK
jgi:hypothetical protein